MTRWISLYWNNVIAVNSAARPVKPEQFRKELPRKLEQAVLPTTKVLSGGP